MAAPVFETVASATGTDTITVAKPSGTVDGDLMIAVIGCDDTNPSGVPTGWTPIGGTGLAPGAAVYWKLASSEGTSYEWTGGGTSKSAGGIIRISGAHGTTPIAASPTHSSGDSTQPDPPASGSVSSGDYLAVAVAIQRGAAATRYTQPSNYTERLDLGTTGGSSGNNLGIGIFTRSLTSVTSEDPGVVDSSVDTDWHAYTILVAAAAPAGNPPRRSPYVQLLAH